MDIPFCRLWAVDISHLFHDDVIKWKHCPRYWPFVRGIHRSPVNSPHKGQWCGALMFTLICARINGWVNNREAGDLRRYSGHYDVIVMCCRSIDNDHTICHIVYHHRFILPCFVVIRNTLALSTRIIISIPVSETWGTLVNLLVYKAKTKHHKCMHISLELFERSVQGRIANFIACTSRQQYVSKTCIWRE